MKRSCPACLRLFTAILLGLALPASSQERPDQGAEERERPTTAGQTATIVGLIDFLPPGARSLGFGGAFIGLADDATAAESNPAGLTILTRPEVSIHVRNSSFLIPFESFAVSELSSALGPDRLSIGDEIAGIVNSFDNTERIPRQSGNERKWDQSVTSASFMSVVVPLRNLSLSGYYQETVNVQDVADSFFLWDPGFIDFFHIQETARAKLRQVGFAAGYRVTDRLSIGGSVRRSELELVSTASTRADLFLDFEFFDAAAFASTFPPVLQDAAFDAFLDQFFVDTLFEGAPFTDFFEFRDRLEGTATDITYSLGVLFDAHENFKVGGVYKKTGAFDFTQTASVVTCLAASPSDPVLGTPTSCSDASNIVQFDDTVIETKDVMLEFPDFFGAGVAAQFLDQSLTVAVDLNLIAYSSLDFENLDSPLFEPIEDATILRVGAEKVFVLPYDFLNVVSVRGGFFTDPDHDGFRNIDSSENHITFGLGAVFGGRFQIDFGSEFSESVDNLLVSAIYRF